MKSRTPSDSAIVAIFRDKRKPQNAARSAFPLDFMGIFQRCGDAPGLLQGGLRLPRPTPDEQGQKTLPLLMHTPRFYALHEIRGARRSILTVAARKSLRNDQPPNRHAYITCCLTATRATARRAAATIRTAHVGVTTTGAVGVTATIAARPATAPARTRIAARAASALSAAARTIATT
ncbi:hypothetical protein R69927_07252 [Paraburkholderia domus]|jgi:hypothetical protein|uniref:Uncharacterized protein n=1 Tax=Paraburkholderia domus TaxID=2793075 RepID=A0A9N8MWV3_9BURK|nr:hypothetical protein R75483_01042 [Paraburkholderia domus]CAE6856122.1 hypothetical protein R70006_07831 [Paraburkholderia domus]CAE6894378.1 hypothetical protein R69749_07795 [Paraburkholderia domus]CAE6902073.1 hypothetical protein R70199_03751 [Paraburkholderia domus]CAE6916570.1 hypothetical protein R70211_04241 [Paraburkholderia domus]